jgi:hypothetical protein
MMTKETRSLTSFLHGPFWLYSLPTIIREGRSGWVSFLIPVKRHVAPVRVAPGAWGAI